MGGTATAIGGGIKHVDKNGGLALRQPQPAAPAALDRSVPPNQRVTPGPHTLHGSRLDFALAVSNKHACRCVGVPPAATVGVDRMSDQLEWRERLEGAHKQMQEAMTELITNKNYSEAERLLHVVDKRMLDLIEDMGGTVIRSGLWT
jgi:hypothetical protein